MSVSGLITGHAVAMATALAGLLAGALLGIAHFGSLWWNVRIYARGGALAAFALQILRMALIAAGLWGVARLGSFALIASAPGVLLARGVMLRRFGRVS
jgi:F1F0 ATPase subunit 2